MNSRLLFPAGTLLIVEIVLLWNWNDNGGTESHRVTASGSSLSSDMSVVEIGSRNESGSSLVGAAALVPERVFETSVAKKSGTSRLATTEASRDYLDLSRSDNWPERPLPLGAPSASGGESEILDLSTPGSWPDRPVAVAGSEGDSGNVVDLASDKRASVEERGIASHSRMEDSFNQSFIPISTSASPNDPPRPVASGNGYRTGPFVNLDITSGRH